MTDRIGKIAATVSIVVVTLATVVWVALPYLIPVPVDGAMMTTGGGRGWVGLGLVMLVVLANLPSLFGYSRR